MPILPHRTTGSRVGFTLIEVLVVVAIIALLAAILLPSLAAARDQARKAQCLSHLQQFGRAFHAYGSSEKGYLCSGMFDPRPGANYPGSITDQSIIGLDRLGWVADVLRTTRTRPGDMLCPNNEATTSNAFSDLPIGLAAAGEYDRLIEKGINTNYCQSWYMALTEPVPKNTLYLLELQYAGDDQQNIGPLRLGAMQRVDPSRVPLLCDGRSDPGPDGDWVRLPGGRELRSAKNLTDGPRLWPMPDGKLRPVDGGIRGGVLDHEDFGCWHGRTGVFSRHVKAPFSIGNVLFGDGHAASFRDIYTWDDGDGPRARESHGDGHLDNYDLAGKVFDGTISLGRRSKHPRYKQ